MNKKIATMERSGKISDIFKLLGGLERLPQVEGYAHLDVLSAKWVPKNTFPVRIQEIQGIELKSDRSLIVNGRKIELPVGVKHCLTVAAIKKLAGSYMGSLTMIRINKSAVRLNDDDIIEIPLDGGKVDLQVVPSFATE